MSPISSKNSLSAKEKPRKKRSSLDVVRTLSRPDEWAIRMGLRVDARPFSLDGREYVQQVIRDYSPEIWCPKAAQMAYTVSAITKALHNCIERQMNGLYLLPVKTGAIPFVQARIDPVVESNPILEEKFGSVDNRLHKQTVEGVNLYIRGTNIVRELQEVPVDFEIWDEYDRMVMENMEDARHRMDGSEYRRLWVLSTPTVDGYGVYSEEGWDASDQHRWEVPCPACGRFQVLNFDEPDLDYTNVKLGDTPETCVVECAFCKKEIKDKQRRELNKLGRWTPMNLDGRVRGYHISQLNSPTQPLYEIMKGYFLGQRDAAKLRSFWNQNMGRAYTAKGDKITEALLDSCRVAGYKMGGIPNSHLAIGIDVGTFMHVWCWHFDSKKRKMLWNLKIFKTWQELDNFLGSLSQWVGIIDAHPEKKAAHDLAMKYHGKLRIGFTDDRMQASEMANFLPIKVGEAGRVNIDKTMAMDTFVGDYIDGNVVLPSDARELGEHHTRKGYNGFYYQQMQLVRVTEEDTKGKEVARWKKNKNADHWHHAGMMATVAGLARPQLMVPGSISQALNRSMIGG